MDIVLGTNQRFAEILSRIRLLAGTHVSWILAKNRAILDFAMMIRIKSMMRRRVNRVRPSGLVCP